MKDHKKKTEIPKGLALRSKGGARLPWGRATLIIDTDHAFANSLNAWRFGRFVVRSEAFVRGQHLKCDAKDV